MNKLNSITTWVQADMCGTDTLSLRFLLILLLDIIIFFFYKITLIARNRPNMNVHQYLRNYLKLLKHLQITFNTAKNDINRQISSETSSNSTLLPSILRVNCNRIFELWCILNICCFQRVFLILSRATTAHFSRISKFRTSIRNNSNWGWFFKLQLNPIIGHIIACTRKKLIKCFS